MKNKLLILLLSFLIYNPAFSQDSQIDHHLEQIENHVDAVRGVIYSEPTTDFDISLKSENLFSVTWLSNQTGLADIEYGTSDFQSNYANNVDEIPLEENKIFIGVGKKGKWQFRPVSGDVLFDTIYVPNDSPRAPPEYEFWHSLWDSWNYDGEFNTIKVPGPSQAKEVLDIGLNVIVSLSHRMENLDLEKFTDEENREWGRIIRTWTDTIKDLDPERTRILLWDEPMIGRPHKSFTKEELEWMADTAHAYWGDEYKVGFSFTRNTMLTKNIPQNINFVFLPMYLFHDEEYGGVQIWSKQEFDEYFDFMMVNARDNLPNGIEIFTIGQGFYTRNEKRWRKPPLESVQWYLEAVWRNNLQGILWWFYSGNKGHVGLKEMPEYFEEILKLN